MNTHLDTSGRSETGLYPLVPFRDYYFRLAGESSQIPQYRNDNGDVDFYGFVSHSSLLMSAYRLLCAELRFERLEASHRH
jgi:hypothetical protein